MDTRKGPAATMLIGGHKILIIKSRATKNAITFYRMFSILVVIFSILLCNLSTVNAHQSPQQPLLPDLISTTPTASLSSISGSTTTPNSNINKPSILPPAHLRPTVRVNIRDFSRKLSEEIGIVTNRSNCVHRIERFFDERSSNKTLEPAKIRDYIIGQLNSLLEQHRQAVGAIVTEAERLAVAHTFVKNLTVNYTDVHRLRNELEPVSPMELAAAAAAAGLGANDGSGSVGGAASSPQQQFGNNQQQTGPQFTSINGGTPVPGAPEFQTPVRSIVMQTSKNFGDLPVNTSMSAVHLPLPIYAGLPEIMNGIAWTEKLDGVFRRNLANFSHVHYQYYGDHLGFLRTFPAHKWRIPRSEPDLFDARTRPWYVQGASSPKDMVILVDSSGSMTGLRREIARGVVFEILDTLTSSDYFSVMRFAEQVTPVGLPKCNLRQPKMGAALEEMCRRDSWSDPRDRTECLNYRSQWNARGQYLIDHPEQVIGKNASYLSDELYRKSLHNITQDIQDAYLLPATSRNVRYLKANFTMPTAGIANFTKALMSAFELLQSYNRTTDLGAQCNKAIMLITDGAIRSHAELFNRYNYPGAPVRVFTYMIGREVGDIRPTKAMACGNRGYYTHVINLGEVREQVQKYLPVMARPMVLGKIHPVQWTHAYGDETHQVLTDSVLETKRRERARIIMNEERERLMNDANASDVINIELTNIPEYDELPQVDEQLKNRLICEDNIDDDPKALDQSWEEELDPLGYSELACHWSQRRADLLTSVVKPVYDNRNSTLYFQRVLHKNIWQEQETQVRNAQLLGVAAVDIRLADMMRLAPSHLFGPNGYAALVGQSGFVMQHPELRALLEDPFDKQSKVLKPYFSSVDLTHLELVYHRNESDQVKGRAEDGKLLRLREAAVLRKTGQETFYVKRATDCRRRPHIRQQVFYHAPIRDTPFTLMIALPTNYGLNRVEAKLELNQKAPAYFGQQEHELWTLHPDFKYCEVGARYSLGGSGSQAAGKSRAAQQAAGAAPPGSQGSVEAILKVMEAVNAGSLDNVVFDNLGGYDKSERQQRGGGGANQQAAARQIVCDSELFPALLFDAAATYEQPNSFCGATDANSAAGSGGPNPFGAACERPTSSFANFYRSLSSSAPDGSCPQTAGEMRSKLASIYGLEISYVATRSGLTRVKAFDHSPRIRKLAKVFLQRHNKAVDEAWYSRTVDWNLRFDEGATIISVPFNAYIRLIAKLRQRITQRHPAINDTRSNCDPSLEAPDEDPDEAALRTVAGITLPPSEAAGTGTGTGSAAPTVDTTTGSNDAPLISDSDRPQTTTANSDANSSPQNDEPTSGEGGATSGTEAPAVELPPEIDYSAYSSFDFLDLLTNSSVHVSASQSVIAFKGVKSHRSPVAVTGLLYDYATFARRFLNSTSLLIQTYPESSGSGNSPADSGAGLGGESPIEPVPKVQICPNGDCPTRCGFRNDTIDCLLVDNNGYIVVGEELPYVGRPLADYDDQLMRSLVDRRVYHAVTITDYQAICQRNDPPPTDQQLNSRGAPLTGSQISSSGATSGRSSPTSAELGLRVAGALAANLVTAGRWIWSALVALVAQQALIDDLGGSMSLDYGEWPLPHLSAADGQSAVANQSLLAMLPNKTYLRACERSVTLYETRPVGDHSRLASEAPEYFVTRCGCLGWYVYEQVAHTNLVMLIVNTTSACSRRCATSGGGADQSTVASTQVSANFVPVLGSTPLELAGFGGTSAPNRSAEEQVCAMLERDAQLLVKRPETCYASHPEERHIQICGSAAELKPLLVTLITCLLAAIYFYTLEF